MVELLTRDTLKYCQIEELNSDCKSVQDYCSMCVPTLGEHRFSAKIVLLQAVDEWNGKLFVHVLVLCNQDEPEIRVDATLDSMRSKPQVDISRAAQRHVVLNS